MTRVTVTDADADELKRSQKLYEISEVITHPGFTSILIEVKPV